MKKTYETPSIEVVKFQYRDQVVLASGGNKECSYYWTSDNGQDGCRGTTVRPYQGV